MNGLQFLLTMITAAYAIQVGLCLYILFDPWPFNVGFKNKKQFLYWLVPFIPILVSIYKEFRSLDD